MKISGRRSALLAMIFLAAWMLVPAGSAAARPLEANAVALAYARGYTTLSGSTAGQPVGVLKIRDQAGTADNPARYLGLLTAPNPALYSGYRTYVLPAGLLRGNVISLQVRINYKGPARLTQAWTWSLYNWSTHTWVRAGDNAAAVAGRWTYFTFPVSSAVRFVNSTGQIRLQVRSNNSNADAKLDYEALAITYKKIPTTVTTLAAAPAPVLGSALLTWTVPAPAAVNSLPAAYEIRFAASPITTETAWAAATPVSDPLPPPHPAGTQERVSVTGLIPGTPYYFGVRVRDAGGVLSAMSNSPAVTPHLPVEVSSMDGLIAALEAANGSPDGAIINLAAGNYTLLSGYAGDTHSAFPLISKPVGLYANGSVFTRDAAAPKFRFFKLAASGELYLQDVTLIGGFAYDADFNSLENGGGAIYMSGGTLRLAHSTLQGNRASPGMDNIGSGGGIAIYGGTALISNSSLLSNEAVSVGGAVYQRDGTLELDQTEVRNNHADGAALSTDPGLYWQTDPIMRIRDSVISGNAAYRQPAILAEQLEIERSTIAENSSVWGQPAIEASGQVIFRDSVLYKNTGGGLSAGTGPAGELPRIENSCIMANVPGTDLRAVVAGPVMWDDRKAVATGNYWGEPDGPSGDGAGHGDSVSAFTFEPFATAPLAHCPTEPVVSGVSISSTARLYPHIYDGSLYTVPGAPVQFSAAVAGANGANRTVTWSISSGGGSLSDTTGPQVTFTPPSTYQWTTVRASSQANPSLFKEMRIRTAKVEVQFWTRALTVLVNSHAPLAATIMVDNSSIPYSMQEMEWELISGTGSFEGGGYSPLYYYSPSSPGQAVVRMKALADPSRFVDIPITINTSGPAHCTEVAFRQGPTYAVISMSANYNEPVMGRADFTEWDPLIGQQQTVSVQAAAKSIPGTPATEPLQSISLILRTDTKQATYPMSLVSGTALNGTWAVTLTAGDTHCQRYIMTLEAVNALATKTVDIIGWEAP